MIKKLSLLVALICFLPGIQTFAAPPAKYQSKEIFELSRQIGEAARNQIWNEFDFRNYARVKEDASGASYIYFSTAPDDQNDRTFFWTLVDDYFQNHTLEENLSITFHEAFHAFERDAKRKGAEWGAENALLIFEYQESSARQNALFRIESRILRAALQSENKRQLRKKVRQFLMVRRLRQSELEQRFVEFEKGAELNEGLAEYAGTKAVLVGIRASRQKQISISFSEPKPDAYLNKKFETLNSITKIGRNVRLKFYYTGSAQGFLLDRLMPDWKTKVQTERAALQDLLAASAGKLPDEKTLEAILGQNDYQNILRDEEKLAAERKAGNLALLEKTLNQKGKKYVIDYSALSKSAGIRNFDPMNVTMVSPTVRVHTRSVSFASGSAFAANFSQPVVEDLENKRYTTVVAENENQTVSLDGEVLDLTRPAEKRFGKSIVVSSANFKLEAATAGMIKVTNEGVIISLTEK